MPKKPIRSGKNTSKGNDPTTDYAVEVVEGRRIAGPYVRAAARRHLDDLEHGQERGLRFNLDAAAEALGFFPDCLMVEFEGEVVPFDLMPEQTFVVGSIFGWQRRDGDRWVRRFTSAYIEGGKGSGKTPLAAGIGLLMMLADGEMSAEVYAAGSKRDQAMILFSDAVSMAQRSPQINALHLVFSGKNPVWQMTDRSTNSKFRPLSSDKKKSGLRVHCGLVDELQEHQDRYTVDILKDGFKARKQPLLFVITNSGFDRASICWEWHEHACAVVEGLREDDQLFAYVMALDDADDPLEDESCWPKTNPGLGRTITLQYLRQQVSEANQIPGRENQVRRLNFCQWTDADLGWMTRNSWKSIEEELVEFKKPKLGSLIGGGAAIAPGFLGAMCYLGLDLAYAFDLAALAFLFPEGERLIGWIEYFTAAETAAAREKKDAVPYVQWIGQGLIHGVPGKVIRKEHIAARIAEASGQFDIRFAAFDRYRHKELDQEMAELGVDVPWIEHPQGFRRAGQLPFPQYRGTDGKAMDNPLWMPDSIEKLEARIIEKTIGIQPSPVTRQQVSSVVTRQDPKGTGGRIFNKAKAVGRIDGIVALAMADGAAEMRLPTMDISGFLKRPVMS